MKYMNTPIRLLTVALCFVMMIFILAPAFVFAADNDAISDLALAQGDEGAKTLEDNGYTVMGRPLTGDYRLGYKRGGSAVTGLLVSSAGGDTVTSDGIVYSRVGTLGADSLYLTRDHAAGDAVLSLTLQSDEGLLDQPLYALKNDGATPLRRDDGTPCDFGDGYAAYLFILRDKVFRPYISEVTAVCGGDLRAAVIAAAKAGCGYYYDPGLKTQDGQVVVLGYSRSANEADALTCLAAGAEAPVLEGVRFDAAGDILIAGDPAFRLFWTRDRSVGNPVIGLTGSAVPVRSSDVMNKWAEKTFVKFNTSAASVNLVKNDELYRRFLTDDGALTNVPVLIPSDGENIVTPLAYVCKAEGQPDAVFPVAEADTQQQTEPEPTPDTEPVTEPVTEPAVESDTVSDTDVETVTEQVTEPAEGSDTDDYLDEEPEIIADPDAPEDTVASVFGNGSILGVIAVIALAVIGAALGFGLYSFKNRKSKKEEGSGDEN